MNAEADKLRAEIATADKAIAEMESRPGLTAAVKHQIDKVKGSVRDMRIQLAGLEDRKSACPICDGVTPPGWLVCEACSLEVPVKLKLAYDTAYGIAHARRANNYPAPEIAYRDEQARLAKQAIISHLKQHGNALPV
jgi:hypothetical protein